jgi:hypothetical protein
MRSTAFLLCFVASFTIAHGATDKVPKAPQADILWASISVTRPIVDRSVQTNIPFSIAFGLVNDGDKTLDPELRASRLLVNGKELEKWSLGGGPQDARFVALPPGDYLSLGCNMEDHFQTPGVYRVVWKGKRFQSPEIVFRVMPQAGGGK